MTPNNLRELIGNVNPEAHDQPLRIRIMGYDYIGEVLTSHTIRNEDGTVQLTLDVEVTGKGKS